MIFTSDFQVPSQPHYVSYGKAQFGKQCSHSDQGLYSNCLLLHLFHLEVHVSHHGRTSLNFRVFKFKIVSVRRLVVHTLSGERGGLVVESLTPEQEVGV